MIGKCRGVSDLSGKTGFVFRPISFIPDIKGVRHPGVARRERGDKAGIEAARQRGAHGNFCHECLCDTCSEITRKSG